MSLIISLVDTNPDMCQAWAALHLPASIRILNQSIDTVPTDGVTVYVSPSNSYGIMQGGIDRVYCAMFPGIEDDVHKVMKQLKLPLIPVTSAMLVPIRGSAPKRFLIACPSMLQPGSPIENPKHIMACYQSVFTLIRKLPFKVNHLIIPGIGTGVGGIDPGIAAAALILALKSKDTEDQTPDHPYLVLKSQ